MEEEEMSVECEDTSSISDTPSSSAPMAVADNDEKARRALEKALILTCPLCLHVFCRPKLLACSHSFCLECLEVLVQHREDRSSFPCPSCRKDIEVPRLGVASFQDNFYLDPDELDKARRQCLLHAGQEVITFCLPCELALCRHCLKEPSHQHHVKDDLLEEDLVGSKRLVAEKDLSATFLPGWKTLRTSAENAWNSVLHRTGLRRKRTVATRPRRFQVSYKRKEKRCGKVWLTLQRTKRLLRDVALSLPLRDVALCLPRHAMRLFGNMLAFRPKRHTLMDTAKQE